MKLSLGTVQFGLDYGIAKAGKPTKEQVFKIINYALLHGVKGIDTASGYGNAESLVGEFFSQIKTERENIDITTKPNPKILEKIENRNYFDILERGLEESLKKLNLDYVDNYLFHNANLITDECACDALFKLKEKGLTKKVGISVYTPEQAMKGIADGRIDSLQIPYNVFDKRLNVCGFFDKKMENKFVYARSTFLQGLLLMELDKVPSNLVTVKPLISNFIDVCKKHDVSRFEACMYYTIYNTKINYLVFGVDNLSQLKEIIKTFDNKFDKLLVSELYENFCNIEEKIVNPSMWDK